MKIHKTIARTFGYELISQKKYPTIDSHLQRLFELYRIDCILDVGANVGQYAQSLRKIGFDGSIHSFEPVSSNYLLLQEKAVNDPHWHVYPFALGATETESEIHVSNISEFSSFRSVSQFGNERFDQSIAVRQTETVKIIPLDVFLNKHVKEFQNRKMYLKMDTQGFDMEVLSGAKESIDQMVALQTELSFEPIYEQMPGYLEMLTRLDGLGFAITGLYPISRDRSLQLVEMDCIAINRAFIKKSEIDRSPNKKAG